MAKIIEQQKRFVSEAEAVRHYGISRPTLRQGIKDGIFKAVQTEAGHYRVDISDTGDKATAAIMERLDEQGQLLKALAGHLGIPTQRAVK